MYSKILVPLDASATSHHALLHAAVLARLSGATVVLLHIVEEMKHANGFETPRVYVNEVRPGFLATGQTLLDDASKHLAQEGIAFESVLIESQGRRVFNLIVQQAAACACDLIMLGTHGRRGMDRLLLGSDAEQVARLAPVPVMLVRRDHAVDAGTPALAADAAA